MEISLPMILVNKSAMVRTTLELTAPFMFPLQSIHRVSSRELGTPEISSDSQTDHHRECNAALV